MIRKTFLLALVASLLQPAFQAYAVEDGAGHYMSGSFVDFSGMPPTAPGFYLANYFAYYHNGTVSASQELPFGGIFAAGVTANVQAEVPLLLYAYPFNFYGVTFSSGIGFPIVWIDVEAAATFNRNNIQLSGKIEQSTSGLGDIQLLPLMAGLTNGDFTLGGLLSIYAPSGNFDAGQLANPGSGYWTFGPTLAFSWISSKIGTEFSVFTGLDFNTKNNNTDYQSGDIFHVDATLAQHLPLFGGVAGLGASAFYLKQISGDTGSGATLGDFKIETYGVGPTVSYIHKIGKSNLVLDASWLPQLHTVNTTKGDYFWIRAALAF